MKKEFRQILRDPRMRSVLFIAPIIQMTLFGFALSTDIQNVRLAAPARQNDPIVRHIYEHALASGFLPATLLSGFIFPIESMPRFFRILTCILPARWFTVISRGVFLQNSTLYELRIPFMALSAIAIVMITLASRKFKTDLEP